MQKMWQEPQFQSLGWEDPLEKEMTTHSMGNPIDGRSQQVTVHGVQRVGHDFAAEQQNVYFTFPLAYLILYI